MSDNDLPGGPIRTMSAQRVQIRMNPDGSIIKIPPPSAALQRYAEVDEELDLGPATVAAPIDAPKLDGHDEAIAPTSLQGMPVDVAAVTDTVVMKDDVDHERPHDVAELDGKSLNETKHIMKGVPKEDLWALMRRFDKQIEHVRVIDPHKKLHGGRLDLRTADKSDDALTADKMRYNLERLYLTVGLGMIAFSQHMIRLSNWTDQNRSAAFAGVYFVAWFLNLLMPTIFAFLAVLIAVPASRSICFPTRRIALIDPKTSKHVPAAPAKGEKISHNSITGAPEAQKGEAAEQEAKSFVAGIGTIAVGLITGTKAPAEKEGKNDGLIPDPTEMVGRAADAFDTATDGRGHQTRENKTKAPIQNSMWDAMEPIMHGLAVICDTWEKMANALSPTPPFHTNRSRMKIATLLVPAIFGLPFLSYEIVFKTISFAVGAGFFGQPWIVKYSQEGLEWLNTNYPHWVEALDPGRTLLRGVPTDAQLTLTLMRIAEAQHDPLPPPPRTAPTKGAAPPARTGDGTEPQDRDSDDSDIDESFEHPSVSTADQAGQGAEGQAAPHGGLRGRLTGMVKGTVKLGVEAVEVTHRAEAATVGAARDKVGVLPPGMAKTQPDEGPDVFHARYNGKKGNVIIEHGNMGAAHATVAFQRAKKGRETAKLSVADITEIRKIGGLGWKGKLVAGWALGEDIPDGMEITLRDGSTHLFTAIPRRNELFNRLVSMGAQRWESC